jgi:hypothetical protein
VQDRLNERSNAGISNAVILGVNHLVLASD